MSDVGGLVGALVVAAGQAGCVPLDIAANVATAARLVRRAAARGVDIVVLPELFLTGYELPDIVGDPRRNALDFDDSRLEPLAQACAETRTAVVAGRPTRDGSAVHISVLVLGRDGRPAARYDKEHVTAKEQAAGITPGTERRTFELDGWRLGLAICADASHPAHAAAAKADGCDAYLVSGLFDQGDGLDRPHTIAARRAEDNALHVVLADHSGPTGPYRGCGHSSVWHPDGTLLAATRDDPGIAVAKVTS
ncbi:MAG TPA: carbon-nitrogen hydrolase family protein [Actinophytocola sp.]|uniref:carbon-nitrogen hydrolase family protein n=1 Tax=Actinophytocola sp. TaxID=1872138 RepID=UPI002F944370